jgi:hypothetical protein
MCTSILNDLFRASKDMAEELTQGVVLSHSRLLPTVVMIPSCQYMVVCVLAAAEQDAGWIMAIICASSA